MSGKQIHHSLHSSEWSFVLLENNRFCKNL